MKLGFGALAAPLCLLTIVGMMLVPLPLALLDVLLLCNLSVSLLLLLVAVYLREPEEFTALPALLLITTLFRLGLNISTTRQLLSTGHAPQVITTFGECVVSGNLVVGAVLFVIITLVQFVVIAKGAERVAEVAARFTLDAMPGKQMAIDADLRSGIITFDDAKVRRSELQREAKLYGALDGAMKFVKGDAIAGIAIAVVNIIGGLLIGVTTHGLSLRVALHKYTLYTVGDGLASQIPALLVSVAAGIIVTRVSDGRGTLFSKEILRQLSSSPEAVALCALVISIIGLFSGVSLIICVLVFLVLGVAAVAAYKGQGESGKLERKEVFSPKHKGVLAVEFSSAATKIIQEEQELGGLYTGLREKWFEGYGVALPDLGCGVDINLSGVVASCQIRGIEVNRVTRLVATHGNIDDEIQYETAIKGPVTFSSEVIALLDNIIKKHWQLLLDDSHTRRLLDLHQPVSEDLSNCVIGECISVTCLTAIVRELIREGVSVRDFSAVLQAIADEKLLSKQFVQGNNENEGNNSHKSFIDLLSAVRKNLSHAITCFVVQDRGEIEAHLVSADLDELLSGATLNSVPFLPQFSECLRQGIMNRHKKNVDARNNVVIVCSKYARYGLSRVIPRNWDWCRVLDVEEIPDYVELKIVGTLRSATEEAVSESSDSISNGVRC